MLSRREPALPEPSGEQPVRVVREVALRHGVGPDAVTAVELEEPDGKRVVVTVHAPRGFAVQRFSLDLQATVHNLGGRLKPMALSERGGYGRARLEGVVGGVNWRVLVLGEPVRTPRSERTPTTPAQRAVPAPQTARMPQVSIVLDDAGHSLDLCAAMQNLPRPVAVAVLPNTPHATAVALCLAAQGREILLHLPMQPYSDEGPGPGADAIEAGMGEAEIGARVERALARVPGVRGVNNHMGSLATSDEPTMQALARVLQSSGLYFVDSRTSPESVAEAIMRDNGIPALRRDVFLDVVDEAPAIRRSLQETIEHAEHHGRALAIGHVHDQTLAVLGAELPSLQRRVVLVPPSALASR